MKKYAIIVAGGSGIRMNPGHAGLPKQFMEIAGKPLLLHTIESFYKADHSITIIVALPDSYIKEWETLTKKFESDIQYSVVRGGKTRFESVKNGLEFVKEKSIVAVHDGVRPLASTALINKCFEEAEKSGNAVPAISLNESLRKLRGGKSRVVDRTKFAFVQAPQCFDSEILLKAYKQPFKESFTDDATVVESMGEKIHLVEGERENIKITFPADLLFAEALLKKKKM